MAPWRVRRSRGSVERQVAQPQPITGTPKEVPVPRKCSFISPRPIPRKAKSEKRKGSLRRLSLFASHLSRSYHFDLERIRRAGGVHREAGGDDAALAALREPALDGDGTGAHHRLVEGIGDGSEDRDDAPDQRELVVGPPAVGEGEDRDRRPEGGDDAGGEAGVREGDDQRGSGASHGL